jgi:hypothetical protein
VFGQHAPAPRVDLDKLHGLDAARPGRREAESADATEGVNHRPHTPIVPKYVTEVNRFRTELDTYRYANNEIETQYGGLVVYTRTELAERFRVSPDTISKYVKMGLLPPPSPPRGPLARYGRPHVERMEQIWGRNGLKDQTLTLKDLAERPFHPTQGWFQA